MLWYNAVCKIEDFIGLTFVSIEGMELRSSCIVFTTDTGRRFEMSHVMDCCEQVELEDIYGAALDLLHTPILAASEETNTNAISRFSKECWTFYRLSTIHGTVVLRWYGANDYYSLDVTIRECMLHPRRMSSRDLLESVDVIESTLGAVILKIRSGSAPANCAAVDTGTVLASRTLPYPWRSTAANGTIKVIVQDTTILQQVAEYFKEDVHFRIYSSDGATCQIQGTVTATGGSGDMTIDNTGFALRVRTEMEERLEEGL